ncbi:MAG: rhodanese-like domain-containing protein [Actinomycetota bacterium]|nr:rhodanese-like domain-containing protein [Actinomycetota bacterium]
MSNAIEQGDEPTVTGLEVEPAEVATWAKAGEIELIDVRQAYEWEAGRIAGARHIEVNDLTAAAGSLPKDRKVVFYCRGGSRSSMAAEAYSQAGFAAHNMSGGIAAWADQGLPLEPPDGEVAPPRPV